MSRDTYAPKPKSGKPGGQSRESKSQVNFEKAQGSSRHDEADLRDVARKAAKKSQHQNSSSER